MNHSHTKPDAFTLIELLTVIAIIAVLMGLLFPTIGAVRTSARKAQAMNDCVQTVNAIKAYYTEYGKYPIASEGTGVFEGDNSALFAVLRADDDTLNPRRIVFFEGTEAKEPGRYGFAEGAHNFLDPWGNEYNIRMDGDYDNQVDNPTSRGPGTLRTGVIAWSLGPDGSAGDDDDYVVSWQ